MSFKPTPEEVKKHVLKLDLRSRKPLIGLVLRYQHGKPKKHPEKLLAV
jgi:hypothetical protein